MKNVARFNELLGETLGCSPSLTRNWKAFPAQTSISEEGMQQPQLLSNMLSFA